MPIVVLLGSKKPSVMHGSSCALWLANELALVQPRIPRRASEPHFSSCLSMLNEGLHALYAYIETLWGLDHR